MKILNYNLKKGGIFLAILIIQIAYFAFEGGAAGTNVFIDLQTEVGILSEKFLGANTYGFWGGNLTTIDRDSDGVRETASNWSWHWEKFNQSKITNLRADMNLESSIWWPWNGEMEIWNGTTSATLVNSMSLEIPHGMWTRTESGHSCIVRNWSNGGSRISLNLTKFSGIADYECYTGWGVSQTDPVYLEEGHVYELCAATKGTDVLPNAKLFFTRMDTWGSPNSTSWNATTSWTNRCIKLNVTSWVNEGWLLKVGTKINNKSIYIDNMTLTQDGQPYYWYPNTSFSNAGNMRVLRDSIRKAAARNVNTTLIIAYMPKGLQNISSWCNRTQDFAYCPATDVELFANVSLAAFNFVTDNGLNKNFVRLEGWNEPDLRYTYIPLLNETDIRRVELYNRMVNATYNRFQVSYPSVEWGVPVVGTTFEDDRGKMFLKYTCKNLSWYDALSVHFYQNSDYWNFTAMTKMENSMLFGNLTELGCNYANIWVTEWNHNNQTELQNFSIISQLEQLQYLAEWVSIMPSNSSHSMFVWQEQRNRTPDNYFDMVQENNLENGLYHGYNVSWGLARMHLGHAVKKINVLDPNITVIATGDGQNVNLTIGIYGKVNDLCIDYGVQTYNRVNYENGTDIWKNSTCFSLGTRENEIIRLVSLETATCNAQQGQNATAMGCECLEDLYKQENGICAKEPDNGGGSNDGTDDEIEVEEGFFTKLARLIKEHPWEFIAFVIVVLMIAGMRRSR